MKTPILDELKKLNDKDQIPMHMPGHKRKYGDIFEEIGKYDITEIRGYDNKHEAEGIIRESMLEMSKTYGSEYSWYLINGSTGGIHAAITSVCNPGEHIIIGRNCHKAVYHIAELLHLKVHYIMPAISEKHHILLGIDDDSIHQIEEYCNHYDIKAVVITSPTYEGIVSDIKSIHKVLSEKKIPFIVDEAHGAHLRFHETFPSSAIEMGADLVIQSSHKTLPSMTQTAMLHLCSDLVKKERVEKALSYYETSSPSYILMASTEYGIAYMDENVELIQQYVDNLAKLYTRCGQLKNIYLLNADHVDGFDKDPSKIVIMSRSSKVNGKMISDILYKKYNIELEMAEMTYCLAMTSVMDQKEDYESMVKALYEIDSMIDLEATNQENFDLRFNKCMPEKCMETWECDRYESQRIDFRDSVGKVAANTVALYPPGVPILIAGEKIIKETVENINYYLYNGYCVTGISDYKISVIKGLMGED